MMPHEYIQKLLADRLRGNETLLAAGVTVLEQNSQDLAFMLEKEDAAVSAPVAVVTCDKMRKARTSPRVWELECAVMVTETAPTNRERTGFLTALDVAFLAAELLDGMEGVHQTGDVTHTTPGDGILEAEARFACRVTYEDNEEQETDNGENN